MELVHVNSCYSFLKTAAGTAAVLEATLQENLGECCVTQGSVFLHVSGWFSVSAIFPAISVAWLQHRYAQNCKGK